MEKQSKCCPVCKSQRLVEGEPIGYHRLRLNFGFFRNIHPTAFACCDCGYISLWVENSEDQKKVETYYAEQKSETR